ncbi:hypothetical protein OAF16_01060 [Flavobacteriales bacterium]|nr:hypothetical protein [Flavobacteriales bacterium]
MKRKNTISKNKMHLLKMGVVRAYRKEQGYFDGRYVSRVQEGKKMYSRKNKHKNKEN